MATCAAFYPALVPLTGDHACAAVLSHLMATPATVPRRGLQWLVRSRAQLCAETAITLDQYKRIIPRLVDQGWIVTERHLCRDKVTPYLRLAKRAVVWLAAYATNPVIVEVQTDLKKEGSNVLANGSGASTASTQIQKMAESGEGTGKGKIEVEKEIEIVENKTWGSNWGWLLKATEIVEKRLATSTTNLGAYWKSRVALITDEYQRPLSGKQAGQLKQLAKYLGPETRAVIAYAVEHWHLFASRAAAMAGCSCPTDPNIGFLLVHHAVAVNLLKPVPSAPLVQQSPVQLVAPVAVAEPVHVISAQELTKLLEDLKTP